MKKEIWKYVLAPVIKIELPIGAEVLTVQEQYNQICMWVLLNKESEYKEERTFEVYGTGHPITYDMGIDRKYIGTVQLAKKGLVFHVFEYTGI